MREDKFSDRHIGPRPGEINEMLKIVGADSLDDLIQKTIPSSILAPEKIELPIGISEAAYLERITEISKKNKIFKSYIGQGYYNNYLPSVIKRNILENPNWYTEILYFVAF